jgi:hypothetical protein
MVAIPAYAQQLTPSQINELQRLHQVCQAIDGMESRGSIATEAALAERRRNLQIAAGIVGETVSLNQLAKLVEQNTTPDVAPELTSPDDVVADDGYFTFINAMWVVVGFLLLVSLGWIFFAYIAPLLSPAVLEMLSYLVCIGLVLGPERYLTGGGVFALAIVGAVGLGLTIAYTISEHIKPNSFEFGFGVLCLVWGAIAIHHQSSLIGAASVLALLWLLGSWVLPFVDVAFIFDEGEVVPAAFWTSAALLGGFTAAKVWGEGYLPYYSSWVPVFQYGVFWLCGLAYSSGLLVLASAHYKWDPLRYLSMQTLAIGSAVAALYFGSVFHIDLLREVGGSFTALYLISKFFDLPWKLSDHWCWAALALAVSMYFGVDFMEQHPQFFLGF